MKNLAISAANATKKTKINFKATTMKVLPNEYFRRCGLPVPPPKSLETMGEDDADYNSISLFQYIRSQNNADLQATNEEKKDSRRQKTLQNSILD